MPEAGTTTALQWFFSMWPVCPVSPGLTYSLRGLPFGWSRVEPFAERRPAHRYACVEGTVGEFSDGAFDVPGTPPARRKRLSPGIPIGEHAGPAPGQEDQEEYGDQQDRGAEVGGVGEGAEEHGSGSDGDSGGQGAARGRPIRVAGPGGERLRQRDRVEQGDAEPDDQQAGDRQDRLDHFLRGPPPARFSV
jgi:hypothetical protein